MRRRNPCSRGQAVSGKPWTPNEIARFKSLWAKGVQFKYIARELDRSAPALRKKRIELGLPRRVNKGDAVGPALEVYIHGELLATARRRAVERGTSLSEYIRHLIRRDTQ